MMKRETELATRAVAEWREQLARAMGPSLRLDDDAVASLIAEITDLLYEEKLRERRRLRPRARAAP